MAKKILREPEVLARSGVGRTAFKERFVDTGRFKWIRLGPRTKGALEEEVDALIMEMARDRTPLPRAVPAEKLPKHRHQKRRKAVKTPSAAVSAQQS